MRCVQTAEHYRGGEEDGLDQINPRDQKSDTDSDRPLEGNIKGAS